MLWCSAQLKILGSETLQAFAPRNAKDVVDAGESEAECYATGQFLAGLIACVKLL